MNSCRDVEELLVLYAEGELFPRENRMVGEHLEGCSACSDEIREISTMRSRLQDSELFTSDKFDWDGLPARIVARARAQSAVKRWLPVNLGSFGWAAAVAAGLMLACGVIWMVEREKPRPEPIALAAPGNQTFVRQMQSAYAREETARYLGECQDLLLHLIRTERICEGIKYDLSLEVARARELLQRKRLLDAELSMPEVAQAKDLCNELENLLVNLSTSRMCENPGEIRSLERFIQKEQLLLRISLLKSELS